MDLSRIGIRLAVVLVGVGCSSSEEGSKKGAGANGTGGTDGILNISEDSGLGSISLTADGGVEALRKASCASDTEQTEPLPVVIELVVDTSGSMGQGAPGGGGSKWVVTRDALKAAMDSLPGSTGVGVLYFPSKNTQPSPESQTRLANGEAAANEADPARPITECVDSSTAIGIELLGQPGSAHRRAITSSLDARNPEGGTPTHDAYGLGLGAIQATTLPGKRFIVLITDGQPTFLSGCRGTGNIVDACDPRPVVTAVTDAMASGVETFLIGSPGSEGAGRVPFFADARTWMSMAASAGGTATPGCTDTAVPFCHFDMSEQPNFSTALRGALQQIVGSVLSCEYALPPPPAGTTLDPRNVNVIFTPSGGKPSLIVKAPDGACTTGWQYSADQASIVLCADTCKEIQGSSEPQVDLLFGCKSQGGVTR